MPEIVLVLLFVVAVLFFALYGFIAFLIRLFDNKEERVQEPERTSPRPTLNLDLRDDVHGAARLLNHLFRTEKLDPKTYRKTREFLETEFAEFTLDPKIETRSDSETEEFPAVETIANDTVEVDGNEIVDGNLVEIVSDPRASNLTGQRSERVAPWDLPDPDPEPRRTLKEMLASFMLDKNIRIGELASGILIVGSAVGLVISLRNELQDAIPYFSALLFLLITAAIHAAGIYTLKKWKLRNTSRGTLLIGFLLIPLNFLAACILSNEEAQPRELTDPLLWTAIIVGLVSFGTMTWFSGKCLLRKGQLPLTLAVMGGAIGTLVINRTEGIDESTFVKLALSLILVVSFLAGTTFIFRQQWFRKRWPRRAAYRMLIFLGISGFAFINGAAMLVIRAEYNPPTWVALAPSFAIVALVGAWFGNIIWKGAQANRHEGSKPLEIAGLAMLIFGLMVVAVAWLGSFANPMVLLVTSALMTLGLVMIAIHQHQPKLLIAGWVAFGSFVLCCVNLLAGQAVGCLDQFASVKPSSIEWAEWYQPVACRGGDNWRPQVLRSKDVGSRFLSSCGVCQWRRRFRRRSCFGDRGEFRESRQCFRQHDRYQFARVGDRLESCRVCFAIEANERNRRFRLVECIERTIQLAGSRRCSNPVGVSGPCVWLEPGPRRLA